MLVLAALVSLQAFFAMAVVYLSFLALESGRGVTQSRVDIPLSQRGPRMLQGKKCEIAALQAERDRSINSPCATSTNLSSAPGSWFLSGWYLRLRRLYAFLMSCSDADLSTVARNQSSRILLPKLERTKRTVKDFVQVCRTDKYSTHEEGEKKKEWVDSHLAGLEHGQDERRQDT